VLSADGKTVQYSNASGDLFKLVLTDSGYDFTVQQTQQNATKLLDFGSVKAGGPQETLTVSTVGANPSLVKFDGLIVTNDSDPTHSVNNPAGASTNDDLNPDSLGFGVKGGQASQMNNNEGFSVDLVGDAEFSKFTFGMQAIGNVKSVNVTYWTVDEGVLSAPTTTTETLLGGQGVTTYAISTPGGVDQIYVEFEFVGKNGVVDNNAGVRLLNFTETEKSVFSAVDLTFGLKLDDNDTDTAVSNPFTIHVDPGLAIV
jgi:hypothetical protein